MEINFYTLPVYNIDTAFLVNNTNKNIVDIKYLYWYLKNKNKWFHLINGSTRPATRISDWKKLKFKYS